MHKVRQRAWRAMPSNRVEIDSVPWCLALICGCFTLTSESYLNWLYRLIELSPAGGADWHALVGNYVLQGAGMLLAALHMRRRSCALEPPLLLAALVLHITFAVPASLATTKVATVIFGLIMALLSGVIQSFYLTQLVLLVKAEGRGVIFGVGYACSSGLTWLLSSVRTSLGQSLAFGLVTSALFTAATMALVVLSSPVRRSDPAPADDGIARGPSLPTPAGEVVVQELEPSAAEASATYDAHIVIVYACAAVLLMSAEKSLGFGFPPTDLALGVSVEFSRLFYAAGLVVAGIAADYSRGYGAACGLAAMITPFAMLALSGEPVSGTVLWSLDYLLYGFFALYRVMLFLDLASREDKLFLAGYGLMLGRFGDAAGNALCLSLGGSTVTLVGLAGIMLVCVTLVALQLFPRLYTSEPTIIYQPVPYAAEEDQLSRFVKYFDLSRREQEVLQQVLARHTNVEAAEELFVSESTIKFHMRNLLRKTGCKTRVELRDLYADWH